MKIFFITKGRMVVGILEQNTLCIKIKEVN